MLRGLIHWIKPDPRPTLNPAPIIARSTRWLQARFSQRPIKGLTRVSNLLSRWLPPYQGVVHLEDGIYMQPDSRQPAERWLLYSGNYQPALTLILKQRTPSGGYCLDIGANLGFYTIKFARWAGPTGRVVAFEANPAQCLAQPVLSSCRCERRRPSTGRDHRILRVKVTAQR